MSFLSPNIFDPRNGARPATYIEDYTASPTVEHEINIAFKRDSQSDTFGESRASNYNPVAWALTTDLPNVSISSKIIVHYGFFEDENGNEILDQSGAAIIAENEYTYFVSAEPFTDAFGITELQLSLTAPR